MDSWATSTTSANIKFEDSPAESLLSTPDEMYPSLFGAAGATPSATVNPVDMLTPAEDETQPDLSMLAGLTTFTQTTMASPAPASSTAGTPEPEKKPAKKRKSWGQVLPEPKTNLPPRKRAKTEDEKEQRRVERVLRNRRAAQSSRERKRLEVEGLEQRNKELEAALHQAQQFNMTLLEEIQKIRQGAGVSVTRAAPSFEGLRQTPVTLSQELFGSQDSHGASSLEHLLQSMPSAPHKTVNPASLSPALSPVSEMDEEQDEPADAAAPVAHAPAAPQAVASPDTTQHPAAMLCPDLQCRSAEAPSSASWLAASQRPLPPAMMMSLLLPLQFLLASTSAALLFCQRPLMQIAMSMKAGFSLPPTQAMMNTIIWLVTTPYPSRSRTTRRPSTSTSTSSSPTSSTSPPRPATNSNKRSSSSSSSSPTLPPQTRPSSSSLRLRTLRKILTCSPTLARPLMDATMAVLRLVSSEGRAVVRVPGGGSDESAAAAAAAEGDAAPQRLLPHQGPVVEGWPMGAALPSKEVLLALLWVLRVEERRLQIRAAATKEPGTVGVPNKTMAPSVLNKTTYVLKVSSSALASHKRAREEEAGRASYWKRRRFS